MSETPEDLALRISRRVILSSYRRTAMRGLVEQELPADASPEFRDAAEHALDRLWLVATGRRMTA